MASKQSTDPLQVPPGSILLVVHDFIARSPDELSLAKGDRIELIERDDDFGDGWFLGRHMSNGSTGLFPEVYTTPAPKGTLASSAAQRAAIQATRRPVSEDHKLLSEQKQPINIARYSADTLTQRPPIPSSQPSSRTAQAPQPSPNQVMNETLSVIDEHITDMHTPRQSYLALRPQASKDSASAYGSEMDRRASYINGQETDEEELRGHTESEVMQWTPERVAEHLEDAGVEKQHCDVFREQEISGEVLLAMEQSAIFIKEFELGSVGRRLKTWQKVRALQDEVRATAFPGVPRSVSDYSANGEDSTPDPARMRSSSTGGTQYLNPTVRALPSTRGNTLTYSNGITRSPRESTYSQRPESITRPSAQNIRTMNHSRRHSSIGSSASMRDLVSRDSPAHRKSPSMDRTFSFGGEHGFLRRLSGYTPSEPDQQSVAGANDLDRGYFSGTDADSKRGHRRSVLQKRSIASAGHSRNPSESNDVGTASSPLPPQKMDSPLSPMMTSQSAFGMGNLRGLRSVSSPKTIGKPVQTLETPTSPVVTKLEYGQAPGSPAFVNSEVSSAQPSPPNNTHSFSFFGRSKATGLRIASDAVTQNEKASVMKQSPLASPRTGSTTPSTDTRSLEMHKSEQSRVSNGSSQGLATNVPSLPVPPKTRPRAQSKKMTSAYTRGLEKKSPTEQIESCDYSGWMKKKSASLVGSWKPRLFVLRGRRLSYYYADNDKEEKGLIDISGHRVLPAENDKITGLHAQLTGAASPSVPEHTVKTSAEADLAAHPAIHPSDNNGLFIFKLVPPRQGMSKAVNFTKPVVHYFAVNSRQEGRLWMAALMKATIDYDASGKVTTSYNQNTISLAKARARMERPPALREGDAKDSGAETPGDQELGLDSIGQGLGIGGLDGTVQVPVEDSTSGAAEVEVPKNDHRDSAGLDSLMGKEAVAFIT